MTPVGSFTIAADHPSLAGHFPGRPVVPGVVLLDHALAAILRTHPGHHAAGLPTVKFTRPVLPGQAVGVACTTPQSDRLAFACSVDGAEVARGTLLLGNT